MLKFREVCAALLLLAVAMAVVSCAPVEDVEEATEFSGDMAVSRQERLEFLEMQLDSVRRDRVHPKAVALDTLRRRHAAIKQNGGWFPDQKTKDELRKLENNLNYAEVELVNAQREELALVEQMKPLYGIVSTQFVEEQKRTVKRSFEKIGSFAYNHAWWDTLLHGGRQKDLQDVLLNFVLQIVLGYVIAYPFAFLYYCFWTAPWSIYAYSSSSGDMFVGAAAWLACTVLFLLPMVALGVSGYYALKYAARNMEQREGQYRAHPQYRYIRDGRLHAE